MTIVQMYSKDQCSLCDEAKALLAQVRSEFPHEVRETKLSEGHPLYAKYQNSVPVLEFPNGGTLSGKITEAQLRASFRSLSPPPRIYLVAKFLEALGMITVLFGFAYGLMGDMWTDLYFFLSGIVIFGIGWGLEKREARERNKRAEKPKT